MAEAPAQEELFVWWREDKVRDAIQAALNEAVETHGNKAKAIAWDIRSAFARQLRERHLGG